MATNRITDDKKSLGTKKIQPLKVLNLTPASDQIAVIMKVTRTESTGSTLDAIAQEKMDSPWREDDMAKTYMSKKVKATKLKDPIATLRRVNELLGRK
jgi:hypothetical protein